MATTTITKMLATTRHPQLQKWWQHQTERNIQRSNLVFFPHLVGEAEHEKFIVGGKKTTRPKWT